MKEGCCRLLVLVSGNGSNLQALLDAERRLSWPAHVVGVVSDRAGAFALERARLAGVSAWLEEADPALKKDERRLDLSERLLHRARELDADLIILAGFLSLLRGAILDVYSGRIINIHPSLLPKFGGQGMYGERVHAAVLAAGEKESGCSVHLVDAGTDTGPVILQRRVPVYTDDTPATLAERIHSEEHRALTSAVEKFAKKFVKERAAHKKGSAKVNPEVVNV